MNPREAITKRVHALLERETRVNLHRFPIDISNADGVVRLEGDVPDIAAKKLALELAASVPGVRGVVDRLRVIPGERRGDGAIRDTLAKFLLQEPEVRNCTLQFRAKGRTEVLRKTEHDGAGEIEFSVSEGVIVLEGHVISQSHRRFAGVLAWWTPGTRDVVNALAVIPEYADRDDEVTEVLCLVLEADPMVQEPERIRPSCRNFVVTLEGSVPTEKQRERAELDAWFLSGVDRVINRLAVIR